MAQKPRRILLIMLEFAEWEQARSLGFCSQFGLEEGLTANGAEVTLIPSMHRLASNDRKGWLGRAREICQGRQFDQVWVTLPHLDYDDDFLNWIASLAPIRVGNIIESLQYTPEECAQNSALAGRKEFVFRQMGILTHVVCADEADVELINMTPGLPHALWWPFMVPERSIFREYQPAVIERAAFIGQLYSKEREHWAMLPDLEKVLQVAKAPETGTDFANRFNELNRLVLSYLAANQETVPALLEQHISTLRCFRREVFDLWIDGLKRWLAIVNLPTFVKCYTTRVSEGMAAGVPVVSWKVPERPRNLSLFEPGREIFLFERNSPEQVIEHVSRLQREPGLARQIALAARVKLARYHTSKYRIQQTFEWIDNGSEPNFGDLQTKGAKTSASEDEYYEALFIHNQKWSAPTPNDDERARWSKISGFLELAVARLREQGCGRPRILDVGCGRGWLTNLASFYGEVEGVEPVAGVLAYARQLFPNLKFQQGTAQVVLDEPNFEPFDIVLTSEVIEHVPDGQKGEFLSLIRKALRPGGYVMLTTPRMEAQQRLCALQGNPDQPVEDWLSEMEVLQLFEEQGFAVLGKARVPYDCSTGLFRETPGKDQGSPDYLDIYQVWYAQSPDGRAVVADIEPDFVISRNPNAEAMAIIAADARIAQFADKDKLELLVKADATDPYPQVWLGLWHWWRCLDSEASNHLREAVRLELPEWRSMWYFATLIRDEAQQNVLKDSETLRKLITRILKAYPDFDAAKVYSFYLDGYHAQWGQDALIEDFFRYNPVKGGYFVDAGAFDGITDSNTHHFAKGGWSGVCIEPGQGHYDLLASLYKGTTVRSLRMAVGRREGEVEISVFDRLSTTHKNSVHFKKEHVEKVRCAPVSKILDELGNPRVDLLSIDTEGMDAEVLETFDFSQCRPALIVINYNGEPQEKQQIVSYLARYGYVVWHDSCQDLFLRTRESVEPPNFWRTRTLLPKREEPKAIKADLSLCDSEERALRSREMVVREGPVAEPASENANRVIALVAAYNESDVIFHVIGDLVANGLDVYLIDNNSTDDTVEIASKWLGNGLIKIERFPQDAGPSYSERCSKELLWSQILRRQEDLSFQLGAAWYVRTDADEFRESPWPGKRLAEAIREVDMLGFNAINFELLNFRPTDDAFVPGTDVREHLTAYEPTDWFDAMQIKAWKNTGVRPELVNNGGHAVNFPGRKVFPINFILRHYPIRGETHGRRKVLKERMPRFCPEERAAGWHVQYDALAAGRERFLHDPAKLIPYDGNAVRVRLLARSCQDLLLAGMLSGGSTSEQAIDIARLCAWAGHKLGMNEALAPQVAEQAWQILEKLLPSQSVGEREISKEIDTLLAGLLLVLAEAKLTFARLAGDFRMAHWAQSLSRVLKRHIEPSGQGNGPALPKGESNPVICPVQADAERPFWSVMIPVFNPNADYLTQVLNGVLSTNLPESEMQIEILDDASTECDVAALVRSIAGDRATVFRQSCNLGYIGNWNACINRARGEWVHILHQDDVALPRFYQELRTQLEGNSSIGAAFCRHAHIDSTGRPVYISEEEQKAPGILANWLERLAVMQRIQFASIVVRRSTYEKIGGFNSEARSAADWEMWMRIAARCQVWYHPEALACFRVHAGQESSKLLSSGGNTSDMGRAIEMAGAYLPELSRAVLMRQARQHYAISAFRVAENYLAKGQFAAVIAQVGAGLELHPTAENAVLAEKIMVRIPAAASNNGVAGRKIESATPERSESSVNESDFADLELLIAGYQENPADPDLLATLKSLRQKLCSLLCCTESAALEGVFKSRFGKAYLLLLKSGIQTEPLTEEEQTLAKSLAGSFASPLGESFKLCELLAYMLYRFAHEEPVPYALDKVPSWFLDEYLAYVLYWPRIFLKQGEADQYHIHMTNWVRTINRLIGMSPRPEVAVKAALFFTGQANFIPLLFTTRNVKELMSGRAAIMEFMLGESGARLDATFPARPQNRKRIKVGFLNALFSSQTETYTTIPSLKLDRDTFEICIFSLQDGSGPLETHCHQHSDRFIILPAPLGEQVRRIREEALDVILIGTNVTAVTHCVTLLALHRLAPLQLLTNSSPITSGMRNMDGYLSGRLLDWPGSAGHHTEKIFFFDGPAHCFDYSIDDQPVQNRFDRKRFGIPEDVIVFVSGANCFKIIPEMQETWANILKAVPGSRLLLHPFNPNWSNDYPARQFERSMREALVRHGLDENHLILSSERLASRSDVKELMGLGDVYLDSFPFAGVNSTADPLELGIPPVAWETDTSRSRMAGSLLREIELPELIAQNEQGYIDLAVKLATDRVYREEVSKHIRTGMAANPRFFDSAAYGNQLGDLLEELVLKPGNGKSQEVASAAPVAAPAGMCLEDAVKLHSAGHFSQAEDIYRMILAADPHNSDAWHLLGILSHQCGKSDIAVQFIEQALQFCPENATYWSNLGEARLGQGEKEKAIECGQRALELQPDFVAAMVNLGVALWKSERKQEAVKMFEKALDLDPNYCEGLVQYGLALLAGGRSKEAIRILKKACKADPMSMEACFHLAMTYEAAGQHAEAMQSYEAAAKLNPNAGGVWARWGWLCGVRRDFQQAVILVKEALRCDPENPEYLYKYGCVLQHAGLSVEAENFYERAIANGYDSADLHNNRGILFKNERKYVEAIESFHRAIVLNPTMESALNNLGAVCLDMGLTDEGLRCFDLVLKSNPNIASVHNNIGKTLKDTGNAADALPALKRALELDPSQPALQSNFLYTLSYVAGRDPVENFNLHRKWGERTSKRIPVKYSHGSRNGAPNKKLRVGCVSPDFVLHPVAYFLEPLLAGYDGDKFEIYAYSDTKAPDSVTERLQEMVDVWRVTRDLSDGELAQTVWEDRIDVLVDLSGHTGLNRIEMFALKPAPVQVSYLGYPATTGLRTIGYRITDSWADPVGMTEHLHTEKLVRLPRTAWCFQAPPGSPAVADLPSIEKGYVTFGSFNNIAKLNPQLFELWAAILNRVPGSHLRIKSRTLHDSKVQQRIAEFFVQRGIHESRLEMSGFKAFIEGHLGGYNQVDIGLDSFPYHGTTTTCEALWMGVPVVTQVGAVHVSRVSLSLLNAVGLPQLAAETPEAYVDVAVSLAQDQARLSGYRERLRPEMLASPLMDRVGFVAAMEAAFIEIRDEVRTSAKNGKKSKLVEAVC